MKNIFLFPPDCKQSYLDTSFVAGGDFVLNTRNGGKMKYTNLLSKIKIMGSLCVFIFLYISNALAQYNYIQNSSFESYDTCPDSHSQINRAMYWNNLVSGTGKTPDYMNSCSNPNPYAGIPVNDNGLSWQIPKTGNAYARLALFEYSTSNPSFCVGEYMSNQLSKKLIEGQNYCIKAYLSLCEASLCMIDGFGFYFDDGTLTIPFQGMVGVNAQIENPDFNYLSDSIGWTEVSGTFTATGNEEYITLGNFKKLQTHYIPTANDPNVGYYISGYYIDDVSVIESNLPAFAGNDTSLKSGDSLFIGRPPEIGLECVWYDMQGNIIGQGAGMWVYPQHTVSYIVEQNLCGNITRDTITIGMNVGIAQQNELKKVRIFPNPSKNTFSLSLPSAVGQEIKMELLDMRGKIVYEKTLFMQNESVEISPNVAQGVYSLHLYDARADARAVRKLVIE